MRNIFAYTAPGLEPEYVSVNEVDGAIKISARGAATAGAPAPTVDVVMPMEQVIELVVRLQIELMAGSRLAPPCMR
jgi:hypothetical protein